jgi:hypothetical protein
MYSRQTSGTENKTAESGAIGHNLRKNSPAIQKEASSWNSHGQGRNGRPRKNWRTTIKKEADTARKTWRGVKALHGKQALLTLLRVGPRL